MEGSILGVYGLIQGDLEWSAVNSLFFTSAPYLFAFFHSSSCLLVMRGEDHVWFYAKAKIFTELLTPRIIFSPKTFKCTGKMY